MVENVQNIVFNIIPSGKKNNLVSFEINQQYVYHVFHLNTFNLGKCEHLTLRFPKIDLMLVIQAQIYNDNPLSRQQNKG